MNNELMNFFRESVIGCCASQIICDYGANALAIFEVEGPEMVRYVHLFLEKQGIFVFNVVGDNGKILRTEKINMWDREDVQHYEQVIDILGETFADIVNEFNIEDLNSLFAPWDAPYILDDYATEIYEHECSPEEREKIIAPSTLPCNEEDDDFPF